MHRKPIPTAKSLQKRLAASRPRNPRQLLRACCLSIGLLTSRRRHAIRTNFVLDQLFAAVEKALHLKPSK